MSASPNQLDEIYKQVREHFVSHPVISVEPSKGDPPDQYEITYSLTGLCKADTGEPEQSNNHKVELAIPFGFPHFPPSCKPKSDIFHPDFDPAAICLGDFWQQDRSLSDLIIHIGRMINGEIYSTDNAFNEDAANWYLANQGKVPFGSINWQIDNSGGQNWRSIDTLDDADLNTKFDFLALEEHDDEEEIVLNTSFPSEDSTNDQDLTSLHSLKSQQKYFALLDAGQAINTPSDELDKLCKDAQETIAKAEKLHDQAEEFENRGDAQIALEKYQHILTIVSDYPTLDSDINRTKQTIALLKDISPSKGADPFLPEDFSETEDAEPESKASKKKNSDKKQNVKDNKLKSPNALFPTEKRGKSKISLFIALATVGLGLAWSAYFYYSTSGKLKLAETSYSKCSAAMSKSNFTMAERNCKEGLKTVQQVRFFKQEQAEKLIDNFQEILQSEILSQGLSGNILFDGKYIPYREAKTLQAIQQQLQNAEILFGKEQWQESLTAYRALLDQVDSNSFSDQAIAEDIKRKLLLAEFRLSYDPARVAVEKKQWEVAIEKLLKAQKVLVSLSEADRSQYSEQLQSLLQESQFAHLKAQGDQSFTGSDWLSAIATYNLALESSQQNALPPESIEAIRNNIKRAELYNTINKGNKAFASGFWDEAIEAYSTASRFLATNRNKSGENGSDINIKKLSRIILQASIIRDRQEIQGFFESNDFAEAKESHKQIIAAITESPFAKEQEFTKTVKESKKAIESLDEKIYELKKIEYLEENYQTLFTANYPAADRENLSNPVITRTNKSKSKSKIVFKMQCTEKGSGRPLTLVMYYAYDKKTARWSLFSEN